MKTAKGLLGIVIWIVMGFFLYCVVLGMTFIAFVTLKYLAWWQLLIGTLGGCLVVYGILIDKIKDLEE